MTAESRTHSQHFYKLLKDFRFAMLQSGSGNLRFARPMTVSQVDDQGTIWFIASLDAERTRILRQEPEVVITCQSPTVFLSIIGAAVVLRDQSKINELWSEPLKVWFPDGPKSAEIALIAVTPVSAEFWDQSGSKGIRYMLNAAKAYFKGEAVQPTADVHAQTLVTEDPERGNRKSTH